MHVYESLKRHTALQKVVIYNFHLNTATSVCMRKVLGQWWARWDLPSSYLKPKRWARHSTVTHWYICIYKLWWVLWRKRVKCFFVLFCCGFSFFWLLLSAVPGISVPWPGDVFIIVNACHFNLIKNTYLVFRYIFCTGFIFTTWLFNTKNVYLVSTTLSICELLQGYKYN